MSRHAALWHRRLDRAFHEALARDGGQPEGHGHALLPTSKRLRDLRSMSNGNRVPLLNLSVRTSKKSGRVYYTGFLGRAKILGFPAAEPDKFGHDQIELYVCEHEPRQREGGTTGGASAATGERPTARRNDMELDDTIPF